MPKADWKKSTVKKIFSDAKLWPWKDREIESILDVACGLSLKSKFLPAKIRVGVDIYEKYFDHIEADVPYVVVKYDVRKLRDIFVPRSFDLVIGIDILEHLQKREGLALMRQCEEIAKKAVVFETTKGFSPQNIDIWGYGGHHWQTHRSGWEVGEFKKMGYKTVVRDYKMSDVRRHTEIDVKPEIQLVAAIKFIGGPRR
ncbi:MAG: class I SAM-dependent methyltransferase [Patescibacteria group bacterium]